MNNICCAILTIFASIFILVVIGLLLAGCEMPISTWNVNETIDAVAEHGEIICHSDGFDEICFVPQPVEVIIEVLIEKEIIVIETQIVEVEVPGETQIVTVYKEVEVPVDPIVEVVTEYIEVPVEVIKIVETEKIVEVPIEVPAPTDYVDREVIKIVEVEVEKIVNVPVEVKVIEYVEVEKEVEVIKEVGKSLSEYTAEEIKAEYKRRGFTPEVVTQVVTQVVTSSNCELPLEVYSNDIAHDNSKLDYWEIGIIYPAFLLGEDYYYRRKGFPRKNEDGTYNDGFDISISVGGTTYTEKDLINQKFLIGGETPVCVHYEFKPETKPTNFEVTVTAEFDGVKYKFQGTLGE